MYQKFDLQMPSNVKFTITCTIGESEPIHYTTCTLAFNSNNRSLSQAVWAQLLPEYLVQIGP